ncbi:MAG TPA: 3-deoxy-manno-octulosonate cytidylyltransferase [Kiloniellales bacterium]|nr:3-deoxy-manno-octulosonate cytidylyltransferase [Kiloniellales bacterium]
MEASDLSNPIILIPARMASQRLPNKPLARLQDQPMIVHVLKRAREAGVAPAVVAAAEQEIVEAVEAAGGRAVLTDPGLPSGSDRIYQALQRLDPEARHDIVVNLQGDLPTLDPSLIAAVLAPLENPAVDIATLAVEITEPEERENPNVVKPVCAFAAGSRIARALYFTRCSAPWDQGKAELPLYHHIGIYAYRRQALERFVLHPPSPLEQRERLEQLRALEAGMRIDVALVDTLPLGVDTPADLERARMLLASR